MINQVSRAANAWALYVAIACAHIQVAVIFARRLGCISAGWQHRLTAHYYPRCGLMWEEKYNGKPRQQAPDGAPETHCRCPRVKKVTVRSCLPTVQGGGWGVQRAREEGPGHSSFRIQNHRGSPGRLCAKTIQCHYCTLIALSLRCHWLS